MKQSEGERQHDQNQRENNLKLKERAQNTNLALTFSEINSSEALASKRINRVCWCIWYSVRTIDNKICSGIQKSKWFIILLVIILMGMSLCVKSKSRKWWKEYVCISLMAKAANKGTPLSERTYSLNLWLGKSLGLRCGYSAGLNTSAGIWGIYKHGSV